VVERFYFDASPEGEQLRRYQLAGQRALLRTVDSLLKLRRGEPAGTTGHDAGQPAATAALVDRLSATINCGPEVLCSSMSTEFLPAVPDPSAGPPGVPVPEPEVQNLRNEPSFRGADQPITAEEATAVIGEDPISRNEPTDPSDEPALVAVGAAIATEDAGPQPEPACLLRGDRTPGEPASARGAGGRDRSGCPSGSIRSGCELLAPGAAAADADRTRPGFLGGPTPAP
jgi:hypothetical protein